MSADAGLRPAGPLVGEPTARRGSRPAVELGFMKMVLRLSWQAQGVTRHHDGLSRAGRCAVNPAVLCLPGGGGHRCLSRMRW